MKRFVVGVLAIIGGLTVLGMGLFLFLVIVVGTLGTPEVPDAMVLELDLETSLIEDIPDDAMARLVLRDRLTVPQLLDVLERAADDDRVVGVVAKIGGGIPGVATTTEVRDAILRFRESGKPAIAWSETFGEMTSGNSGYYLATAFDEIHLLPSGDVGLTGYRMEHPFLRRAFEKFDVEVQMDHRHEYQNLMNLYTEDSFTDAHREASEAMLRSLHGTLVTGIADGRGLPPDSVDVLIDRGPLLGPEALAAGLVDHLSYRDEVYDRLREEDDDVLFLGPIGYFERAGSAFASGETIAIIHGQGGIQRGASTFSPATEEFTMGSDTIASAFREAVENERVKAILFRIDCPGGSYVASDAVRREVVRAREAGKPVVVSMTNAAASGGYFVAMAADRIVAEPTTLTGSIGVLGGKFVLEELLDRFGIDYDSIQTGENGAYYSFNETYDDAEWARLQAWLDRVYADFTEKAAEGRDLPLERIREIAKGRVWTGTDALALGLVDDLGGLHVALGHARELAGIDEDADLRLVRYPLRPSFLDLVAREAGGAATDGRVGAPPAPTAATEVGRILRGASTTDQLARDLLPVVRLARDAGIWRDEPLPLSAPLPRVR